MKSIRGSLSYRLFTLESYRQTLTPTFGVLQQFKVFYSAHNYCREPRFPVPNGLLIISSNTTSGLKNVLNIRYQPQTFPSEYETACGTVIVFLNFYKVSVLRFISSNVLQSSVHAITNSLHNLQPISLK